MAAFWTKHGYSGRRPAAVLVERLRSAPQGIADGPEAEARRDAVLGYVRVIRALNTSIKSLDRSVAAHLGEHRTARSSPPCHPRVASTQPRCSPAGRLPPSLRHPRGRRRPGRPDSGDQALGQVRAGPFPLGVQQRLPGGHVQLRRQLPPPKPLGRRHLPARPGQRLRPPPRHPRPGPRLDPGHLALLARRHRLRRLPPRWRCPPRRPDRLAAQTAPAASEARIDQEAA